MNDEKYLGGYTPHWWEAAKTSRKLLHEYNTIDPWNIKRRDEIIKELFGSIGDNFVIEPPFHCDCGYNIHIGERFYANYNVQMLDGAKITIGDHALIGPNVVFAASSHVYHPEVRRGANMGIKDEPITIGNDVWIGANCVICMGVTIGDGCVIGAGSVVTRDIPPMSIAAGTPCKVIRPIVDEDLNRW